MRTRALTAALVSVLLLAGAASADYRATGGPACVSHVSAVASGTLYGAGDCGKGIVVSRRLPGRDWETRGAFWPAGHLVEAVAADEVATFVVLSRPSGPPDGARQYVIGKLLHRSSTLSALTTLGSSDIGGDRVSLVARDGRWAAVYVDRSRIEGEMTTELVLRKTLGGNGSAGILRDEVLPAEPSLALGPDGFVLAFTAGRDSRTLRTARAGLDGRFGDAADYGPAAGAAAALPAVVVAGGTQVVAWSHGGAPAVSFGRDRLDLPRRGTVLQVRLAASGGSAFVTTSERFAHAGGTTERIYARDVGFGGVRSTQEIGTAYGRQDPRVQLTLRSTTAARGVHTVAYSGGIATSG